VLLMEITLRGQYGCANHLSGQSSTPIGWMPAINRTVDAWCPVSRPRRQWPKASRSWTLRRRYRA